jgi:hypothetical protein
MVTGAEPPERAAGDGTSAPEAEPEHEHEPVGALAAGSTEPS